MIHETDLWKAIHSLISFPYPQICKHAAALKIISVLEDGGAVIPAELIHAIVFSQDDVSLPMLEKLVEDVL